MNVLGPTNAGELTSALKAEARRLGFSLAGVCPAVPPQGWDRFREWLAAGYAGEMRYLGDREQAYQHPRSVLDGVRSLLMLGWNYRTVEPAPLADGQGRVARYAWGTVDYHDLLHDRLHRLADYLRRECPGVRVRGVVDTAPLLEREFGQLAGLGWIGKNTLLLNRQVGSWFFLAALLTDVELSYDPPHEADHCGTCQACLDACPTQAFPQPYVLDARRCISYLTIELRGAVPEEHRGSVGDWVFGCDICQEVCPWNQRSSKSDDPAFQPQEALNPLELVAAFDWDDVEFRRRFRATPLWRTKRRGLLRNAALVLGGRKPAEGLAALKRGLNDHDAVVRATCIWALGQYGTDEAVALLRRRQAVELDPMVHEELTSTLTKLTNC